MNCNDIFVYVLPKRYWHCPRLGQPRPKPSFAHGINLFPSSFSVWQQSKMVGIPHGWQKHRSNRALWRLYSTFIVHMSVMWFYLSDWDYIESFSECWRWRCFGKKKRIWYIDTMTAVANFPSKMKIWLWVYGIPAEVVNGYFSVLHWTASRSVWKL